MRRGGEKKQAMMAETISLMLFLTPTKSCQTLSPFIWAFKKECVRGMAGLI
jgi:hypothetical protein